MNENSHFLSYKGLESEYWLREWLIEGRCEELDFSRWEPSRWDKEAFTLRESKYRQKARMLTIGEWRGILDGNMMVFKDKHFYVRKGGIKEMFEVALHRLVERWCAKLKLGGETELDQDEVIILDDRTPINQIDSLIVAEAVISARTPPSLIGEEDPTMRMKLRETKFGLEVYEEVGLAMNLDMNNGTVLGTVIGADQMTDICKENNNGMLIIRNGVMERVVARSNRPG